MATLSIKALLKNIVAHKASDLHLVSRSEPQIRIDGKLVPLDMQKLDGTIIEELCYALITDKQKWETRRELKVSFREISASDASTTFES